MSLSDSPSQTEESQAAYLTCLDGSRPKILMAEDSSAARVLTAALLRRMGCDVDAVEHGEEALLHIQNYSYDLVILDIEMPVMDGVVAAQSIKALGGAAGRTPILALSAFLADAKKAEDWLEFFDDSMAKPASREQLRQTLEKMLRADDSTGRPAAGGTDATTGMQAGAGDIVDQSAVQAIRRQVGDRNWPGLIDQAINELRQFAGAMQQAQANGDARLLHHSAHAMKGIASSFGAPRLAGLAAGLQAQATATGSNELTSQINVVQICLEQTLEKLSMHKAA